MEGKILKLLWIQITAQTLTQKEIIMMGVVFKKKIINVSVNINANGMNLMMKYSIKLWAETLRKKRRKVVIRKKDVTILSRANYPR